MSNYVCICMSRVLLALILFSPAAAIDVPAQSLNQLTRSTPLPNGIEIEAGSAREQIVALRGDVLRIRVSRTATLPEDASWAVLDSPRHSQVSVSPIQTAASIGFSTRSLRVELDRSNLALTIRDVEGHVIQQDAQPIRFAGDAFRIFKKMPLDEHFFGLGDKTGPLDRRDEAFTLWNTDAYRYQESTDPLYKAIPFFMTYEGGRAAGVLLDNTWRSSFDFGKSSRDSYSFGAEGGPVDYYFMAGPSPKQVVEQYAWLTGTAPLPPLWTLGFQQSRYSYYPQSEVLSIASRLRADRIPVDAIYLDIDYQEKNRPFTVDRSRFPDFPGMIAKLNAENFHVVAITDLHIAKLPNQNYAPYDSGMANDEFVKNPDGSVYTGAVWPGPSVFPDFTRKSTRAWWGNLYRDFCNMGIAGFWNDMNEPSIFDSPTKTMPLDVIHRIEEPGFRTRTAAHREIHNVYGMENSRATFEGLEALRPNQRPFVLTRASFAGGQRYAATWTGDNSSTWNHLRMTTPMIENLGLSGFAFVGADVGGYAGTPPSDLLTKWLEVAAFQPIDRDHTEKGSGPQEPWVGGPQQEDIRRHFIETRYRLMPYLYSLAEEASRTGVPMIRPLFFEFPHAAADGRPLDQDIPAAGEFMVGPDLLVAPSPFPEQLDSYAAELPSPVWYDFWTGRRVGPPPSAAAQQASAPVNAPAPAPLTVTIHPELATLPVFVRGGAILPMQPLVQSTNETPKGPLTLRVYAPGPHVGRPCEGRLYLDDGKTLNYRRGEFLRMNFTCTASDGRLHIHIGAHQGSYPAWWTAIRTEVYAGSSGQPEVRTVADNGKGADLDLSLQGAQP
jgi:alpha-glucosidase